MKLTRLTNISLEPLQVRLIKTYEETKTINLFTIVPAQNLDFKGLIDYFVDEDRQKDLRVDVYE